MANTGYKGWTFLEEYYTDDNSATGVTKLNSEEDADYIAPVYDTTSCPINNTFIIVDPDPVLPSGSPGDFLVDITSDYTGTFSFVSNAHWCTVTGSYLINGTGYITVSFTRNTDWSSRDCVIVILVNESTVYELPVTQAVSDPYFDVAPAFVEAAPPSNQYLIFNYITSYDPVSADCDQSWCQVDTISGGLMVVILESNYQGYTREVYVTIRSSGEIIGEIGISQTSY